MKEALKLALDALEIYGAQAPAVRQTITAIKEALAQPDYRAVKTYHEGKPVYVSQTEQEPVAYYHPQLGFYWTKPTKITAPTIVDVEPLPLYTTPPKEQQSCDKRPWVGLTDEGIQTIHDMYYRRMGPQEFAKAIEAKLKELNT